MTNMIVILVAALCLSMTSAFMRNPVTTTRCQALNVQAEVDGGGIFKRKNLPVFGVAVGLTALSFQMFVLFPWHERLSDDFSTLEIVTSGEVVEDRRLEDKLDKLLNIEQAILKRLD